MSQRSVTSVDLSRTDGFSVIQSFLSDRVPPPIVFLGKISSHCVSACVYVSAVCAPFKFIKRSQKVFVLQQLLYRVFVVFVYNRKCFLETARSRSCNSAW